MIPSGFGEMIAVLVLLIIVVIQEFRLRRILDRAERREKDMLDRIMARDYETYVNAQVVRQQAEQAVGQMTGEEMFEQGIPV